MFFDSYASLVDYTLTEFLFAIIPRIPDRISEETEIRAASESWKSIEYRTMCSRTLQMTSEQPKDSEKDYPPKHAQYWKHADIFIEQTGKQ